MLDARCSMLDARCSMLDAGLRFLRCLLFQLGAQPTGPLLAEAFEAAGQGVVRCAGTEVVGAVEDASGQGAFQTVHRNSCWDGSS
jgi:hypothetical protein